MTDSKWGIIKNIQSSSDGCIAGTAAANLSCAGNECNPTAAVRMFTDRRDKSIIEAKPFENGVVLLRYALNKKS